MDKSATQPPPIQFRLPERGEKGGLVDVVLLSVVQAGDLPMVALAYRQIEIYDCWNMVKYELYFAHF